MKFRPILYSLTLLLCISLYGCDAIIEPSISKSTVTPEAPVDNYVSTSYTVNFWWDTVNHALSYHLQVVTPSFASPGSLVLDTVIKNNKFSYNLNPGTYQWRVMAENGSSQTLFSTLRNFTVEASTITTQNVQLNAPANNYLTNQSPVLLQWSTLYGATQYQIEVDTNNFINENAIVLNETIPGTQVSFSFPKDQTFEWRVKAKNDTAQAKWSAIYTITYDHTPPAQVSLISPANNATVNLPVPLQWNSSATAVKYKVYVFKSDSVTVYNNSFPTTVTTTLYTFIQGNSGDRVYWKISAVDAAGNEGQASKLSSFVLK